MLFALLLTAAASPPGEVQHVPPDQALAILGHPVADPDGKDIGRLVDVLVGEDGVPQAGVIDFGGFMGVGSRKIAVQWSALHFAPADAKRAITLDLTQEQIKAAPEYRDVAKPAPVVVAPAAIPRQ
ncbi:MAG: PRC-barrel domain-containing protein [Acetobacteraceae bacterium]